MACGNSDVSKRSRELAQALEEKSLDEARIPQPIPSDDPRARVYLDASLSMAGYVTGRPNDPTEFDRFIDKLGDYLPGCSIFKFGQGNGQELLSPANFDRNVHNPNFYSLTYNPNDALIRQVSSEDQLALSVILTDGVQSDDPGQGNPPVVDAIVEWVKKGGTFGIFVLRSNFSGPFYSERVRAWIRNESGSGHFEIAARPFYAFVLSPTQREFNELRQKILSDFPDTGVVLISDNSVNCLIRESPTTPRPYGKAPPQSSFYWQWFKADLFGRRAMAKLDYQVVCKLSPDYPAAGLSLTAEATTYSWKGRDFIRTGATAENGSDFVYEPLSSAQAVPAQNLFLKLTLVPDHRSDITFYQIRSRANVSSIRADVRDLNTEDDSDARNSEKTYRLSSLIVSLTEAHLKMFVREKSLPRLYLTIENK
jgi:hypothetical protein